MKKLLLLLASGLIISASNGQQAAKSVVFKGNTPIFSKTLRPSLIGRELNTARTTSSVTAGWFDYDDTVFTNNIALDGGGGDAYTTTTQFMWQDTTAIFGYDNAGTAGALGYNIPSTNYSYNTSIGILFQPFATDWTTVASGVSRPLVTTTNGFVIDSIAVIGTYMQARNAAGVVSQSYVDSLQFSFVYGNGDSTTNMEWEWFNEAELLAWYSLTAPDSDLAFPAMFCDTTSGTGAGYAAGLTSHPAPVNATFAIKDTSLTYLNEYAYGVNVTVPAGNFVGVSLSFKSMSTYPALGDSITGGDGTTYYYGSFSPGIGFDENGTTYIFPPYLGPEPGVPSGITTKDVTTGFYKTQGMTDAGWQYQYVPNWAQSASTSTGGTEAYYQQFPMIWFHIQCATCVSHAAVPVVPKAVTKVQAFPVPATDRVNVAFLLSTTANEVTVTLTNLVGQTVATQKLSNVTEGTVNFNTSALSDGMYFYTVNADGAVNTGRIVVAH